MPKKLLILLTVCSLTQVIAAQKIQGSVTSLWQENSAVSGIVTQGSETLTITLGPLSSTVGSCILASDRIGIKTFSVEDVFIPSLTFSSSFSTSIESVPVSAGFLYHIASLNSENGNMQYFFGSPAITRFDILGGYVSAFEITMFFSSSTGEGKMKNVAEKSFSNQDLGNGNAKLNTAGFSYHAVSCFYLWVTADYTARLTAENQGYSLFPYKTYTLDGTSSFSFIGASCNPQLTAGSFSISCLISGLYCLNETSDILRWWIYKNSLIFDGSYGDSRTTNSTITHTGLVILRPEILYRHQFGSVSASKLFPVPINMKNDPMSDNMTATDYLSGGFTISVSFQF